MNFYEVTTMAGSFWLLAPRASDAHRKALAILGHDEFSLTREDELTFTAVAAAS